MAREGDELDSSGGVRISQDLVSAAINAGVSALAEHSRIRPYVPFVMEHFDKRRLEYAVNHIQELIDKHGANWSERKKAKFAYDRLANYASSGSLLDEMGQRFVIGRGLEEKTRTARRADGRRVGASGGEYFERVLGAFRDIERMLKTEDEEQLRQSMPQFMAAVYELRNVRVLKSSLDMLEAYGIINDRNREFVGELEKRAKFAYERGIQGSYNAIQMANKEQDKFDRDNRGRKHIEEKQKKEYATEEQVPVTHRIADYQEQQTGRHYSGRGEHGGQYSGRRIAAAVLSLAGISVLIASGLRATGNVIGVSPGGKLAVTVIGVLILVLALMVGFRKN